MGGVGEVGGDGGLDLSPAKKGWSVEVKCENKRTNVDNSAPLG